MAGAYAALASLEHILEQLRLHPRPPISLLNQQAHSLTRNISSLQHFLEGYNPHFSYSNEADELECRIADAAHAAEDLIEGHILNQIVYGSRFSSHVQEVDFYQNLEKMIEEMSSIEKEVMEIKEREVIQDGDRYSLPMGGSSRLGSHFAMVGFDEMQMKLMDMLITSGKSDRLAISIMGMGGIGKTTLARNVYEHQIIEHHFHVVAWATISQQYRREEVLTELLLCVKNHGSRDGLREMSEDELGETLYKSLCGRRYFIVIDDVWDVEVWGRLQHFFPNNKNGSRIMITTRLANLASQLCGSCTLEMKFLDENESWDLLRQDVFGKESCPLELEEIGKMIARNCRGLPLSIVVVGGVLARIKRSREYWEDISRNLSRMVNVEGEERCLQILYTSYNQLPIHLKPCFLYMAIFPEDIEIYASELIKLWTAEGFLKPIEGRNLEEVGKEYLEQLVDRNLILLHKRSSTGKIKSCKIHDLLRDLCLREADKQKFVGFIRQRDIQEGGFSMRRACVHQWNKYYDASLPTLECATPTRSLIWDSCGISSSDPFPLHVLGNYLTGITKSLDLRLLRVFKVYDPRLLFLSKEMKHNYFNNIVSELLLNLRYISYPGIDYAFSSLRFRHWNLHTLIARHTTAVAPPEIWEMHMLRHVEFYSISFPNPPYGGFLLQNLQTLLTITLWDCSQRVIERIPNLKKLKICQGNPESWSVHYLNNLGHLYKIESLEIGFTSFEKVSHLDSWALPRSLKKLTLYGTRLPWEDMMAKIGSLPLLQVLKLKWDSAIGSEWETVEGQFCSLKSLLIHDCGLVYWTTDSSHFPCLEHLQLGFLKELKEVPFAIGEIATLQSIKLVACSTSAVASVKNILEDQRDNYGNDVLQVQVENFLSYKLHIV